MGLAFRFPEIKVREATAAVRNPHFVATYWEVYTRDKVFT